MTIPMMVKKIIWGIFDQKGGGEGGKRSDAARQFCGRDRGRALPFLAGVVDKWN